MIFIIFLSLNNSLSQFWKEFFEKCSIPTVVAEKYAQT